MCLFYSHIYNLWPLSLQPAIWMSTTSVWWTCPASVEPITPSGGAGCTWSARSAGTTCRSQVRVAPLLLSLKQPSSKPSPTWKDELRVSCLSKEPVVLSTAGLESVQIQWRCLSFSAWINKTSLKRNLLWDSQSWLQHTWKSVPVQIYCPEEVCGLLREPLWTCHDLLWNLRCT